MGTKERERTLQYITQALSANQSLINLRKPAPLAPAQAPAVGGADEPELAPVLGASEALERAVQKLIAGSGGKIKIISGRRSRARQQTLWENALKKYGSPTAARKWVAPPGRSKHETGEAFDLGYADAATKAWAHQTAATLGLHYPLANEDWHVELAGSRGKKHKH